MKRSIGWVFTTAALLLLGFGIGLVIAWGVLPVRVADTNPGTLQQDIKARYRVLIAENFLVTGDRTRAEARLNLLNDKNIILAISDQITNKMYVNEEQRVALVTLQAALAGSQVSLLQATALSSEPILETSSIPVGIITVSPSPSPSISSVKTPTPFIITSPTAFIIISRTPVCDIARASPLLQVNVLDSYGKPLSGIVLIVSSVEGSERIITGLKPDIGAGSADISLSEGTIYTITIANASGSSEILTTAQCTSTSGTSFPGGWILQIQY
jgi:hypothetical protein